MKCSRINYAKGKFWASEHAVVVALFNGQDLLYIGELLRTMNLNQYSRSAAQPGLAVDTIINQPIPVPPCAEQMQIARYIDQETSKIDQLIIGIERARRNMVIITLVKPAAHRMVILGSN